LGCRICTVCLPALANEKKRGYLNKIIESKELDVKRVLSRVQSRSFH
jgi:hypothetical protein